MQTPMIAITARLIKLDTCRLLFPELFVLEVELGLVVVIFEGFIVVPVELSDFNGANPIV